MVISKSEARDGGNGREGGARADFIASLGKRVEGARAALGTTTNNPAATGVRDDLRRRLHALGTSARLLHLEGMAASLTDACTVLDRAAQTGAISSEDVGFISQVLDDLPALAWGENPSRERRQSDPPREVTRELEDVPAAMSVLVVGPSDLVEILTHDDGTTPTRTFECELLGDAEMALELARLHAPDLVVLSGRVPGGEQLVASLVDDPLTEPVPVVVVGPFASPEIASHFTALGVVRVLADPKVPGALRAICDSVFDERDEHTLRVTLGEPSLEQLGERLADEIRHALVDSLDRPARALRIPLGEGTEVFGALWGAIARIQEVITEKTGGMIQYGGGGPEGAIALAPSLHREMPAMDRIAGRRRGAAADVRLDGRRVIVADDDPGVTWFISDLLRTAGCTVYEALDGTTALNLAFEHSAELVVSDILMPGLDGFALSRALRRDVALRDTPVILLSWKEDLLQRVRELGANAAAYLRKESDSRAIVARVREVLRPRARLEARLRVDGEVRGRLDGVTVRTLLELMTTLRPNARVAVRDASFLYEVELRDGAPCRATRTSSDGAFKTGPRVIAGMLGVGAGRFVVTNDSAIIKRDLSGSLAEQLADPIACARGALAATTGAHTLMVDRILVASDDLPEHLQATPEPERSLVQRIADGASPRKLLLEGQVAPSQLEDVLAFLAARGSVIAVRGAEGMDLLGPAVRHARAVLLGQKRSSTLSVPPPHHVAEDAPLLRSSRPPVVALPWVAPPAVERSDESIGSLDDAVLRELHDETPLPAPTVAAAPMPPAMMATEPAAEAIPLSSRRSKAARRSTVPGLGPEVEEAIRRAIAESPPVQLSDEDILPVEATDPAPPFAPPETAAETGGTYSNPFSAPPIAGAADTAETGLSLSTDANVEGEPAIEAAKPAGHEAMPFELTSRRSLPPSDDSEDDLATFTAHSPGSRVKWAFVSLLPIGAMATAWYVYSTGMFRPRPRAYPKLQAELVAPHAVRVVESDLPPDAAVNVGQGWLALSTLPGARVRADGLRLGEGPDVSTALASGKHVLEIENANRISSWTLEIAAGRTAKVDLRTLP